MNMYRIIHAYEVLVEVLGLVNGVRGVTVFLLDVEDRGLLGVLGFIIDVFELRVTDLTLELAVGLVRKMLDLSVVELFVLTDFAGFDLPLMIGILLDGV